jgi:hypothetical protein
MATSERLLKLTAEKQKQHLGFASHLCQQEMQIFDLLYRQAEADYDQFRVSPVTCNIHCQEKRLEGAIARENREEEMRKAA